MKRALSAILAVLLILSSSVPLAAADYAQMHTTERAVVYERANTAADEIATVKQGYAFTPVGSTKSFWKIEIQKKNSEDILTGYLLKDQVEALPVTAPSEPSQSGAAQTVRETAATVYWVPNGQVYHITQNCSTLKRSRTIHSGSVSDSGKPRACKVCG